MMKLTRVVRSLNGLVNDTIADAQGVEVEGHSLHCSVADQLVVVVEVPVESRAVVSIDMKSVKKSSSDVRLSQDSPSVALGSQVKLFLLAICTNFDTWIKLRERAKEALQDLPCGNRGEFCGVNLAFVDRVENRVAAGGRRFSRVDETARDLVEAANFFGLIGEAYADRLREEEHVADFVPGVLVDVAGQVLRQHARAQLFEEADQAVASRTAIEPESDGVVGGVSSRVEEPEEGVDVRCQIDVSAVAVHARRGLADTFFAGLFVSDGDIGGRGERFDVFRVRRVILALEQRC